MNLSIPDNLPNIIAELLQDDARLSQEITEEYDRLISIPPGSKHDEERGEARNKIRGMKSERDGTLAKLCGWWRATLTTNGIEWEAETTTHA